MQIGSKKPQVVLYLNCDKPTLPNDYQHLRGAELSQAILLSNNNNWRKILSLFAKLTAPDDDWRSYLHRHLLAEQQISFNQELLATASKHIIAGKSNWQRFGAYFQEDSAIHQRKRIYFSNNRLFTPYLDYRQFPNSLVADCRQLLYPH
ncbi:DUF6942 family protein [Agarivorans sp. MS3-6]